MFHTAPAIRPVSSFAQLSHDDLEDIRALFSHRSARSFADDKRDLRYANLRRADKPLTFSLRSVLPGNYR